MPLREQSLAGTGALAALLAAALLSGCATDLSSAVMPGVQLARYRDAFVVCRPQDDVGLCALIGAEMGRHGFTVAMGPASAVPPDADLVVTYEDRWAWDITMYLLTLRLDARDPKTNLLLATSRVYRTSFARHTPAWLARRAVDALVAPEQTP